MWVYGHLELRHSRLFIYPQKDLASSDDTADAFIRMELNFPIKKMENSCGGQYVMVRSVVVRGVSYYDLDEIQDVTLLHDSGVNCDLTKDIGVD